MNILLKVLWVEDDKGNIEEYCDESFDQLFDEPIVPITFEEACKYTEDNLKYDFVIIDIDLTRFTDFNSEYVNKIKDDISFKPEEAGIVIFTMLLESGFPKERILFLTANAGTENNTYDKFKDYFNSALMPLPEYLIKDGDAPEKLSKKLESRINPYLTLRRGIIEGCGFLKEHINDDNFIRFSSFVKGTKEKKPVIEISSDDIKNYLDTVEQFLPVRQPKVINDTYRLFLRTLVHEWEESIDPQETTEKYGGEIHTYAGLSKQTRNWVSHAKLLEPLNSEIIAFLFLANMRAMFKLSPEVQDYEHILLKCITNTPDAVIDDDNLDNHIIAFNSNVDQILFPLDIPLTKERKDKNGSAEPRPKYFSEKINDVYKNNTGKSKQHNYKRFLFQYFFVNQQYCPSNLTANSDDFLPTLARHIYSYSFLEE